MDIGIVCGMTMTKKRLWKRKIVLEKVCTENEKITHINFICYYYHFLINIESIFFSNNETNTENSALQEINTTNDSMIGSLSTVNWRSDFVVPPQLPPIPLQGTVIITELGKTKYSF